MYSVYHVFKYVDINGLNFLFKMVLYNILILYDSKLNVSISFKP